MSTQKPTRSTIAEAGIAERAFTGEAANVMSRQSDGLAELSTSESAVNASSSNVKPSLTPYYSDESVTIFNASCLDALPCLADCSVDSVVTDPPYELGFMAKSWDRSGIAYNVEVWCECLRVLKPGGHLLAFGGSRTYHRLACAIEDAGFEIRDQIQWIYGSGFPKSLDVSKAIDAAAGAERTQGAREWSGGKRSGGIIRDASEEVTTVRTIFDRPATDAAKQWNGWGTALKPAHEILTLAYKPHEYETARDKIDANLLITEARLWSLLPARIATEHFKLSEAEQSAVFASAQWTADERNNTQAALNGQMDTSQFALVMSTCLNTVRSWRSTLDALCEAMSTSTIETRTSLTTDLRILNCLLSQTTPSTIIKAASLADGQALNALPVAQHFAAARLKLNGIQMLFARDAATSKAHTLHRGEVETDGIVLARKPLIGTVAQNILEHGTGGLNVDGCRVEGGPSNGGSVSGVTALGQGSGWNTHNNRSTEIDRSMTTGRWPANVILSYPEDEYELRASVTAEQKKELFQWLYENA